MTSQGHCASIPGQFVAINVACNSGGNMTSPCCLADFDKVGGVSVQDIFGFLTGWFSADPRADANAGGGVTVTDIFIFLGAWFAGCS